MKRVIIALLALSVLPLSAASPWPDDRPAVASFGGAVAVDDGRLFISEPSGFKYPGRVHVYAHEGDAWTRVAAIEAPDAYVGDGFGQALAANGNALVVSSGASTYFFAHDGSAWQLAHQLPEGARSVALSSSSAALGMPGQGETPGVVLDYALHEGAWHERGRLEGTSPQFGSAVALHDTRLLVGGGEQVTFYGHNGQQYEEEATFAGADLGVSRGFGAAVSLSGTEALVGSPLDQERLGSVQVFRHEGTWQFDRDLKPAESTGGGGFGTAVAIGASGYWVGVPFAERLRGAAHHFARDGVPPSVLSATQSEQMTLRFGSTLAVDGTVAVVGMPGAAYGEGSAMVFTEDAGTWQSGEELFDASDPLDPILGTEVQCDAGDAAGYECGQVDLVSFLPLAEMGTRRGVRLSDVWGWTDSESGREYGLVGHLEGTVFVDLTDPSVPVFLGELPRTEGSPGSTWRDIKVYKDHAFIVADGAGAHGMQVFDLTRLRSLAEIPATFEADLTYDGIHSAHNIVINEDTGYAFAVGASGGGETCGGGLHMIDIREPKAPTFVGCFADETTGRRKTGYSHDAQCVVYHGPDATYQGREICIGANETAISIADVTDKEAPVAISAEGYPDAMYVHQGWLSDDHTFFYQNDELDEISQRVDRTRTLVWDVRDLDDPVLVNSYYGPASATDHNLYVRDNLMYQTNNASGLRIIDVTDRAAPREVGFFDTTPYGTNDAGFNGTWSSYPYFESGIIVVTSRREGLFVLKVQSVGS